VGDDSGLEPLPRRGLFRRLSVLGILVAAACGWRLDGAAGRLADMGSEMASGSSGTAGSGFASICARCRVDGEVEMRLVRLSSRRI
jgi:hypothetical protein